MKFVVSIERKLFSGMFGYEAMGAWIYYAAAILGAIIGLLAVKDSAIDGSLAVSVTTEVYFLSICLGLWAMAIADAVLSIDNGGIAFKRASFNCIAIFLLMLFGAIAAIVVLIFVALMLFLTVLSGLPVNSSRKRKNSQDAIIDGNGNMHYISCKNGDGSISTTDGKRYRETSPGQWREF